MATLIGVALGGALSFSSTFYLDRSSRRREESGRWMLSRLDAYTAYITAVKRATRLCRAIQSDMAEGALPEQLEGKIAELAVHESDRSVSFERVVLLGSQKTIALALQLNQAVWRLEQPCSQRIAVPEAERRMDAAHWLDCLSAFYPSARADLQIGGLINTEALKPTEAGKGIFGNLSSTDFTWPVEQGDP